MLVPAINLATGDFDIQNNKMLFYQPYVYKVNRQVLQRQGQDVYNGIANGNPLLNNSSLPLRSQVVQGIEYAVSPLTNSGEIVNVSITTYTFDITTNRGKIGMIVTPPNNPPVEINIVL